MFTKQVLSDYVPKRQPTRRSLQQSASTGFSPLIGINAIVLVLFVFTLIVTSGSL